MTLADDQISLPNNYFPALVQLESLERRLRKNLNFREQFSVTIRDDLSKGYFVEVEKSTCFKTDYLREWYLPHHPSFHRHKIGKVRQVLNGAAKFHGHSLNIALLTVPDLLQNFFNHVLLCFRNSRKQFLLTLRELFVIWGLFQKTDRLSIFWGGRTLQPRLQCQYTPHIFDRNIRRFVLTTLFNERPQTIRLSFQRPQKVSAATVTWTTN